jgi:phosphate transport system permease protein
MMLHETVSEPLHEAYADHTSGASEPKRMFDHVTGAFALVGGVLLGLFMNMFSAGIAGLVLGGALGGIVGAYRQHIRPKHIIALVAGAALGILWAGVLGLILMGVMSQVLLGLSEGIPPRMPRSRREASDLVWRVGLSVAIVVIIAPFFLVLFQVAFKGLWEVIGSGQGQGFDFFFTLPGPNRRGGILNAIVGTLSLMGIASLIGIPLSVLGAVYISEYTRPGLVRSSVEFGSDVLAGIPSIVFGAFGIALFVSGLGFGKSLISGGMTLAFMMIPTILRTTQEALRSVPVSLREASLALGATKWTTTWNVTLRAAFPGVMTGVLLSFGRVMGETAPLILTSGNSLFLPENLFNFVASMPYTIYLYLINGQAHLYDKAHGTALALMIIVLIIDVVANFISRKVTRRLV